ncbi:uncharacterized protein [Macrobrachium rosenbergii]|uniref:uncharacterized protein n=1 Tax=Macrobrachium rosenbergii TaxID=79674 RepID=UPI0034D49C23
MSDGKLYHATYKDVYINTTGTIVSAGDYMGNAGDSFSPNKQWKWNSTFKWFADSATPAGASFFGEPDAPLWPTVKGITIQKATIRIRPSSFDNKTSCPPLKGVYEPSWIQDHAMMGVAGVQVLSKTEVNVTVPLSRSQGANVTYICNGPFYKERTSGQVTGSVTCIPGDTAGTFKWSAQITLPCQGNDRRTLDQLLNYHI